MANGREQVAAAERADGRATAVVLAVCAVLALAACRSPTDEQEAAQLEQQRRLEGAEAALAVGEFDAALAAFERAASEDGEHRRALVGLARTRFARAEDSAGLEVLGRLRDIRGEDGHVPLDLVRSGCRALLRLGEAAIDAGRGDEAIGWGERARGSEAACSEERRAEGRDLVIRGHFALAHAERGDASHHLESVLALEPGNEAASLALAEWHLQRGDAGASLRVLVPALAANPRSRALAELTVRVLSVDSPPTR